jgi:hypothetical protein
MYVLNVNEPRRRTITYAYVKFFSERDHAEQFLDGKLFMQRVAHFRQQEDEEGRWDRTEGVSAWLQKQGLEIQLTMPTIGVANITERDLAAPVSISMSETDEPYIFCLYAYYIQRPLPTDDPRDIYGEDRLAELEANLQIDPKCLKLGPHAVWVPACPFMERLKEAAPGLGLSVRADHVRYYDEGVLNGQFDPKDVPFRKQKRFAYQSEYRICVRTLDRTPGPRIFNIGSLRGFSTYMDSKNLLHALKLAPRSSAA